MTTDPRVLEIIEAGKRLGVEVRPTTFSGETRTAVDAAHQVGCELGQIVKSLVFKTGDEPLLYLVSGANRLNVVKAKAAAEVEQIEKADAAMVKVATGYSIGSTPPFGHRTELRIYMDEDLLGFDEVWAAAGRPDSVFPVDPRALALATGATICSLAER